jgi:hypothetical protein
MGYDRRVFASTVLSVFLMLGLLRATDAAPAAASEVITWNEMALKTVAANGQNGVQITRTLAMVWASVHDALNAINRRYAPYYFEGPGEAGVSPDAAVAAALAGDLGTDQVSFKVTSGPPFPDITRSFTSFSQAAREAADSRVYAGIHFRTACEDGLALGRKIGERTVALYLQPVKK